MRTPWTRNDALLRCRLSRYFSSHDFHKDSVALNRLSTSLLLWKNCIYLIVFWSGVQFFFSYYQIERRYLHEIFLDEINFFLLLFNSQPSPPFDQSSYCVELIRNCIPAHPKLLAFRSSLCIKIYLIAVGFTYCCQKRYIEIHSILRLPSDNEW